MLHNYCPTFNQVKLAIMNLSTFREAGKLKIYKTGADAAPRVTLSLSDATMCLKEPGENDIPREHSLIAGPVVHQTLAAFDHVTGK